MLDSTLHTVAETRFTGSQINYYFICKRKLWLFSHNIELEPESDLVKLGKLLHENRYKKKMKEVQIDRIKVDFVESKKLTSDEKDTPKQKDKPDFLESKEHTPLSLIALPKQQDSEQNEHDPRVTARTQRELVVHEVKRSKKMQNAHVYQLLYYMYWLKENYAVNVLRGVLHYPLLNQNVDVPLTQERIGQIEETVRGISQINSLSRPPEPVWKGYCRSCAYRDLCWG